MFPATLHELASQRIREMRRAAETQRRWHRISAARRWERLAARAERHARRSRDSIT